MFNVKTLNKIAQVGLDQLDPAKYLCGDNLEDPDAILVRSASMHEYEFNPALRCIARAGAGTNNIPLDRCAENGIVVFNTPGANATAVRELALCALLLASRDVFGGIRWAKETIAAGTDVAPLVEKQKSAYAGPELHGKTLGVIGLGAVGIKVANAAERIGMKVYGYDPYLSVDAAWSLNRKIRHAMDLETIFRNCDYITLHVPYTPDTKYTIRKETIALMPDGVRIINLARGELVNDDDMLEALNSGKVARYVTDFPNNKIGGHEKVVPIPHLGASTPESEDNCAVMAAKEIADYLENGNIRNSVNMPSVVMPRSGAARLCIINRNIPNMLGSILNFIASRNVNVENMTNKSRGDYAYTIIDLSTVMADNIVHELEKIDGILRVREIR